MVKKDLKELVVTIHTDSVSSLQWFNHRGTSKLSVKCSFEIFYETCKWSGDGFHFSRRFKIVSYGNVSVVKCRIQGAWTATLSYQMTIFLQYPPSKESPNVKNISSSLSYIWECVDFDSDGAWKLEHCIRKYFKW